MTATDKNIEHFIFKQQAQKYKVHKLYNTTRFVIGQTLHKSEVDGLIESGYKVTIT